MSSLLEDTLKFVQQLSLAQAIAVVEDLDPGYLERDIYAEYIDGQNLISLSRLGENLFNLLRPVDFGGEIWFEGGPPGRRQWVEGPVSYIFVDIILMEAVSRGEDIVSNQIFQALNA